MASTISTSSIQQYAGERGVEARFGIPVATLRTMRCRKFGPPYRKVGARVLYKLTEVEQWLDEQVVDPAESAGEGR